MERLEILNIDFDYFIYDNDIRLNIFDKKIVDYYETLPLVDSIDPDNYGAILGEYERFNVPGIFKSFIAKGKHVIGYDYSSLDLYSQMFEGSGMVPKPITHFLTTNEHIRDFVISNKKLSKAKFARSVGNLYLETAKRENSEKGEYIVVCSNNYGPHFDKWESVRKICFPDNIKRLEDTTGREVRLRMHPSMYTVWNQVQSSSPRQFNGSVGFQVERKIKNKTREFHRQGLEEVYDKIISPSDILDVTAAAHSVLLVVLTTTMRELILNNKNYFCFRTPGKILMNAMMNDNNIFTRSVNLAENFFPMIQTRFMDPERASWLEDIKQTIERPEEFCGEYKQHRTALLKESSGVSQKIVQSISEILQGRSA